VSRRGWSLFAAMSVIWGIPYLLIKVADGGVAPPVLVLARVTIGAALLLLSGAVLLLLSAPAPSRCGATRKERLRPRQAHRR